MQEAISVLVQLKQKLLSEIWKDEKSRMSTILGVDLCIEKLQETK